jgi:hypothetical protein
MKEESRLASARSRVSISNKRLKSKARCAEHNRISSMTTAQKAAAKNNIKNAAAAAKKKKTIAHLPKATRTALGKKGAEAAKKKRSTGN